MFERYTEKARRVIFFARYEASQFGSPYIESEHLLLGFLRENKSFATQVIPNLSAESIREEIERATMRREPTATSVDLPLSNECKRVLAYAAEEAEGFEHKHIGSEHLLLGLLREQNCFAARLLNERGATLELARSLIGQSPVNFLSSVGPSGGASGPRSRGMGGETRVVMRRPIVFRNEADDADLGETFSIDVPRVGDEVELAEKRGQVSRVVYHYENSDYVVEGIEADLRPVKVVVYMRLIET